MASRYQAGPDTVVHFSYRLFDEEGDLVEQSPEDAPLSFLFGYGQLNPALEASVEGLFPGEVRKQRLPRGVFGERDPSAIIEVARQELPAESALGDEFEAEHDELGMVSLVVLDLDDERAVLDANHPLAGQAATVEISVISVRPAESLEIALAEQDLDEARSESQRLLPGSRLLQRPPLDRSRIVDPSSQDKDD